MSHKKGYKFYTRKTFGVDKNMTNILGNLGWNTQRMAEILGRSWPTIARVREASDFREYRDMTEDYNLKRKLIDAEKLTPVAVEAPVRIEVRDEYASQSNRIEMKLNTLLKAFGLGE